MFFNAPVGLFITIERKLGPGQWSDLGSYIHTLMYLARGYGLDTCPQESWARLYKLVGAFLKLPPEQMLFCGVAIGYGDRSHPANSFRSPRAELDEFCTFHGFDGAAAGRAAATVNRTERSGFASSTTARSRSAQALCARRPARGQSP